MLTLAGSSAMALYSPAVSPSEAVENAAEAHADPMTAQAAGTISTALKPESFISHQTAVNLPIASQPAAEPVVPSSTQTGLEQSNAGTLPLSSNSPQAPQDAQTPSDAAKSDTSTPTAVGVVCADAQGVLILDFDKMRCCIQYKGMPHQLSSFDAAGLVTIYKPTSCACCITGQDMSGTEFEKAAGREKAKKWKTSVRVAPVNGKQGEMVGDWLQVWTLRQASYNAASLHLLSSSQLHLFA